ncbi:hypothetical protein Trydic_g10366 [Trypoxylus dichotomus]
MHNSANKRSHTLSTNNQCEQNKYNSNGSKLHSCGIKQSRSKSPSQKSSEYFVHNINTDHCEIYNRDHYGATHPSHLNLSPERMPKVDVYGPALPPPNKFNNPGHQFKVKVYGPALPSDMTNINPEASSQESASANNDKKTRDLITMSVNGASTTQTSEDEEFYGPLPPNIVSQSKAHIALEERALQIKLDQLQKDKQDHVREEWMTQLPEIQSKRLGLGPRQFRANPGPDLSDRSSWTDTPADKVKKNPNKHTKLLDLKDEANTKAQEEYDKEQEILIKKHKKETSLLEIHQSNLKKRKRESGERRPFSREIDLQVNYFDNAQKEAVLKKAQLLDDRFSKGKSKFL